MSITGATVRDWLHAFAEDVGERRAELTKLDTAIGDGDHGTNLDRGFTALVALIDGGPPEGEDDRAMAAARLRTAGRTLISTVGGAAGPLYGTALMRAGGAIAAADGAASAIDSTIAALDAAIAGIQSLGKASAGEKTMLDALFPAAEAGRTAVASGADAAAVSAAMAEAAESGSIATIPLLATKGRASYLGERSIGHQDPGATSAATLLRALADAVAGAR